VLCYARCVLIFEGSMSNQLKSNKTLLKVDKPRPISQHNKSKQYI